MKEGLFLKKKIIIIAVIIIIIAVLLIIPKSTYQKIFKRPNINTTEPTYYQTVFVKNSDKELLGVKVKVDSIEEDEITQKFDILTSQSNLIPKEYSSPIATSTKLLKYEISDYVLKLYTDEQINYSDSRLAVESLAWTFCNEFIKEVQLYIDDTIIKEINGFKFNKIAKNIGVNFVFETSALDDASFVTVIYHLDQTIKPVTYFYIGKDIDFLVSKTLGVKANETINYEIKTDDNILQVDLDLTTNKIDEHVLETFVDSVKYNFLYDKIIISADSSLIYELDLKAES